MVYILQICKRLQGDAHHSGQLMIKSRRVSEGQLDLHCHQEPGRKFVELL
jgi:hypothetical protein